MTTTLVPSVAEVPPPSLGWELMYGGGSHAPVNGKRLPVESAIDGSVIASIPDADEADLDLAVTAAMDASKEWSAMPAAARVAALDSFADALIAANKRLGWLDTVNAGMPITATRQEAGRAGYIRGVARLAMEIKGATWPSTSDGVWGYTIRQPYGVVAYISPFNHPVASAIVGIANALATGNAAIIKPSEHTSLSALEVGAIAQQCFPAGLVSVMTGEGATIGAAICRHPDVPRICFTGSVPTGRAVLQAAGHHIKNVTLELGGKGPLAVLPTADIDAAVEMAVGGMNFRGVQAGQSCQSTTRVLVHRSMYREFEAKLVAAVQRIRIGDPRDPATEMGAMAFRAHRDRVMSYIDLAASEGAKLLTGGRAPQGMENGFFVEPTVFGGVSQTMRIANEEVFGPVVALIEWSAEEELVAIANDVEYGLTARIACGDVGAGMRLAEKIDAGRMWINTANGGPSGMPFGGHKHSGIGKAADFESLVSLTQEKAISVALAT